MKRKEGRGEARRPRDKGEREKLIDRKGEQERKWNGWIER